MEYPESNTSTPRSREVDCEPEDYKVKLMCSYGGKILPRPHDNQLTYMGGDTKIVTVDRNIRYASILNKLNSISSDSNCFKYQLPGEDLDALISVTNDEDLEHMMTEYDRIFKSSLLKPTTRLRLFMFPPIPFSSSASAADTTKSQHQWFVDALNAVQISSSPASSENPDFLFGFDKGAKLPDNARPESECGSEDSNSNSNTNRPVVSPTTIEIQRQIQDTQRMQIAATPILNDPRSYYPPHNKIQPQPRYWQDQTTATGPYSDSPVYLIPSSTAVYPPTTLPPPATQAQPYYGMQRMMVPSEFYREQQQQQQQPVYSTMTQPPIQQPKVGTYQEALGMVRPQTELTYGQVGIDATGRQVYYTPSQAGMTPTYQPVVAAVNQEGKTVVNPNKGL